MGVTVTVGVTVAAGMDLRLQALRIKIEMKRRAILGMLFRCNSY